jgi:hypothetical protein
MLARTTSGHTSTADTKSRRSHAPTNPAADSPAVMSTAEACTTRADTLTDGGRGGAAGWSQPPHLATFCAVAVRSPPEQQKSGKRSPTVPTSEKRLDYICEVEASSRFGGVGRTQQNGEKDHNGRERPAAGGNGQLTRAADETRPLRVTPSGRPYRSERLAARRVPSAVAPTPRRRW